MKHLKTVSSTPANNEEMTDEDILSLGFDFGSKGNQGNAACYTRENDAVISINKAKKVEDKPREYTVHVNIANKVLHDLRWQIGDRVRFGINEKGVLIQRAPTNVSEHTYALMSSVTVKDKRKAAGRIGRKKPDGFVIGYGERLLFKKVDTSKGYLLLAFDKGELVSGNQ